METVAVILVIVFASLCVGVILYTAFSNTSKPIPEGQNNIEQQETVHSFRQESNLSIDQNLDILQHQNDNYMAAIAFVELMAGSYVLVHTIVNRGGTYNDDVQYKKFCTSFSPKIVDSLKSIGESDQDGECAF